MQNLKESKPEPFQHFTAINITTAESFPNCLILSEHSKYYIAGKPFTHWLEMEQPTIEKQLECSTEAAYKQMRSE
jgi:hypothetical protein